MISKEELIHLLPSALGETNLPLPNKQTGKVREWYDLPDGKRLIITTDRLSAFDRILAKVPYKGQVLNQLSAWWFEQTRDIIANHLLSVPDPNVSIVTTVQPLPIEVIVRGYITGVTSTALWYRYSIGERTIYGYDFPEGLKKNQALPEPIITPTTKGGETGHDERLTCAEVTEKGLLDERTWNQVQTAALAIFKRGQEVANKAGLILVDTKYEFGITPGGSVMLIDEIHTPDSSRYWKANTYQTKFNAGEEPENFDKEFVRIAYAEKGYRGDGEIPPMPNELWAAASERYITIYEMLTGKTFEAGEYPIESRLLNNLKQTDIIKDLVFDNIEEIIQNARTFWDQGDTFLAGELIDTHIPKRNRAKWMVGVLETVAPKFKKDTSIDDVIDFAKNPEKFGNGLDGNAKAAHEVVDNANSIPYLPEQFPLTIFILAAFAGKVIYNAQNFPMPFDHDAALTVFEMAKIMTEKFEEEEFARRLWIHLCPVELLTLEKQRPYSKDLIESVNLSRSQR